jgi:hypothetical protein
MNAMGEATHGEATRGVSRGLLVECLDDDFDSRHFRLARILLDDAGDRGLGRKARSRHEKNGCQNA